MNAAATAQKHPVPDRNTRWSVFYFRGHKWYCVRSYETFPEASDDFIKLMHNPEIGAVRIYAPGDGYYRKNLWTAELGCHLGPDPIEEYLWQFERLTREQRQEAAVRAAMEVA